MIFMMLMVMVVPGKEVQSKDEGYQVIPDEAIRLRILANSDNETDQQIKRYVRDEVNKYITNLVQEVENIEAARKMIQENLPAIEEIVAESLESTGETDEFSLEYSDRVAFPTKIYGNYVYPAGEYEAVLITIGEGNGANWWCVLFPPLCFLDFSNGGTVEESEENNEGMDQLEQTEENDEAAEEEETSEQEEEEISFFLFEWFGWS